MPKLEQVKLAVIGGSGLYNFEALADVKEYRLKTPFGDPSDAIVVGTLAGQRVGFCRATGADIASCRRKSTRARTSTR